MDDFTDWEQISGVPNKDGAYLYRFDELDEPEEVIVKDGAVYKNGEQFVIIGCEWKAI